MRFADRRSLARSNRTILLARTRWGRIVRREDFYEDSSRIERLERRLAELGVPAVRRGLGLD
jgi:hypothetical protein